MKIINNKYRSTISISENVISPDYDNLIQTTAQNHLIYCVNHSINIYNIKAETTCSLSIFQEPLFSNLYFQHWFVIQPIVLHHLYIEYCR